MEGNLAKGIRCAATPRMLGYALDKVILLNLIMFVSFSQTFWSELNSLMPDLFLLTGDVDDWDKMLALNLSAPMRLTHAFTPSMVCTLSLKWCLTSQS